MTKHSIKMKRVLQAAFGLLAIVTLATSVTSCSQLKCRNTECENGECVDGSCECDAGWEGDMCDKLVRAKFLGIYSGTEECDIENDLAVVVTDGVLDHEINLQNLFANNSTIEASVYDNTIKIGIQTNYFGDAVFNISGNGVLSGNTITLNYTVEEDGEFQSCSAVLTK